MKVNPYKKIYTSGEVALICHVTGHTVNKWVDAGKLDCYRLPTTKKEDNYGDRRFTKADVHEFVRRHGIKNTIFDVDDVLFFDNDINFVRAVGEKLKEFNFKYQLTDSVFAVAKLIGNVFDPVLVVDWSMTNKRDIEEMARTTNSKVIVLMPEDCSNFNFTSENNVVIIAKPVSPSELSEKIHKLANSKR